MNPFGPTGGPEVPIAPTDLPTPEIPKANFADIGEALEAGRLKAAAAAAGVPAWLDWLGAVVGLIIGTLLSWVTRIIAFFIGVWFQLFHNAEAGTDEISAQAIAGMFGVGVPADAFRDATGAGARGPTIDQISSVVINGLFPGANSAAGGGIAPGHEGANNFIKVALRIAVEGWLQGWVFELASAGQVETFAELKDITERCLGLGRLMRRVLAAPLKILLEDPFTWELNARYHPTLLAPPELVREYLRGTIDRTALQSAMDLHGYTSDKVTALINLNKLHLSSAQLLQLELHSGRTQADTIAALQAQGYDSDTAPLLRFVELQGRLDAWNTAIINELATAVVERKAEIGQLDEFMQEAKIPELEQALIRLHTNNRVAHSRTRFTIAEGQQLVEKGLWDLNQFRSLAFYHGYTPEDELDLELLLLGKIKDQSDAATKKADAQKARQAAADEKKKAAAAKAAEAKQLAEAKGLSLTKFEALVKDGLKTVAEYTTFLQGKGIAADNIAALVDVLQGELDKAAAAAAAKPGAAAKVKAKNLDLAQLDAAAKAGLISTDEYRTRLMESGVSDADASILVELLQGQIATAKQRADATATVKAAAAVKHVNLAEEERAVRLGLATPADFTTFLAAHQFAADDAALLEGELAAQLAADKAAKATKAAVTAGLGSKGLSLPQLEKAVRAGVATITDYRAALAKAGYDATAQDQLVSLLELQEEQDKATLAAKGTASSLLDQRGVSLADLERAVKLGVVPISTYTDALGRAGVDAADAQVLTLSLAAATKQTKAAAVLAAAASKTLAAAGLNLKSLEGDVLAGRLTIAQLQATLATTQLTDAQVSDIVGLLQDELANKQHGDALVLDATARAAAKHLDLAQETAAVKAGVKTLADFETFAASLGYDPADVATLEATLAAQLGAAAAKKAPASKKPAGSTSPVVP